MYKKIKDRNGLTCIVSPMPGMASVSLGVWVGVGGRYEPAEQSGISHLVEHMLFKGTHTRSAKGLKEAIEGVGGVFNGFTSDEVTCYMVKVPAKYLELGMDILADMVLNTRFDRDDLLREKYVVCEEIKMYRDQPAEHVLDVLGEIMWPGNPLGRPLTGSITSVKGMTRDAVVDFKERNYHPGNIAVVAAGKVSPRKLFSCAAEKFKGALRRKSGLFRSPDLSAKGPRMKICKGQTQQTHIAIGFPAGDNSIRGRFAAKMMNIILGGNMSSRLFEELREKHGLCYDIASSYKRHSDMGELQVHAGVDAGNTLKSVTAILDELKKLKDVGVTGDELDRAKKYAQGQFTLAMEGTSTRMMWLGDRYMVHGRIPEVEDVLKRIDAVTPRDIQNICQRIFRSSSVNLAMVGRVRSNVRNKIRKELDKL